MRKIMDVLDVTEQILVDKAPLYQNTQGKHTDFFFLIGNLRSGDQYLLPELERFTIR